MKWTDWLKKWGMSSLKITMPFAELEFSPSEPDKSAAWEMYVELLTRITTQSLGDQDGEEETALRSVYSIFSTTREIMRRNGRECREFTKIAVIVLNQIVRPFTAKWHRQSIKGAFKEAERCLEFRKELALIQDKLTIYTRMMADMADVEDLTTLEPDR